MRAASAGSPHLPCSPSPFVEARTGNLALRHRSVDDPTGPRLAFTTENSEGVAQLVLPTFATVAQADGTSVPDGVGTYDPLRVVHAGHSVAVHAPTPVSCTATTQTRVAALYDKGEHASWSLSRTSYAVSGVPLFTNRTTAFLRGEGGFGGERGPSFRASLRSRPRPAAHGLRLRTYPSRAMSGRFTSNVVSGQSLSIAIWVESEARLASSPRRRTAP
jgi:hypothetical protein